MQTVVPPVALYNGADRDSAVWTSYPGTPGASGYKWQVPGGACWLIQSILGFWNTSVAIANHTASVSWEDSDFNTQVHVAASAAGLTAGTYNSGFSLGAPTAVITPAGGDTSCVSGGLPWFIAGPATPIELTFRPFTANQDLTGGYAVAYVTEWDVTGAGSSGTVPEQLGPFMFVPGPAEGVAA